MVSLNEEGVLLKLPSEVVSSATGFATIVLFFLWGGERARELN